MDYIKPSYLFSYWIFGWFIIYMISKFIPSLDWVHKYTNPIYGFYIGVLENLIQIYMIYNLNFKWNIIILFLINIFLFKIIPILILLREPTNLYRNILFVLFLFIIYLIYLVICGTNIYNIYKETSDSIIHEKNKTPFIFLLNYLIKSNT
jgi:hypothetical protein